MSGNDTWPAKFAEVENSPPAGFECYPALIDPCIRIHRTETGYRATLAAFGSDRGERVFHPLARLDADYIVDGTLLQPIPRDSHALYKIRLGKHDPENLKYPDVLALMLGPTDLPAFPDEEVIASANTAAAAAGPVDVPGLHASPYAYQANGIAWMHQCLRRTNGLILADEMGLGKTLQIIALLLLDPPCKGSPALIVCPTSLIANWLREIQRFAPSLEAYIHRGSERTGSYRTLGQNQIVIATYDTVVNDISLMRSISWKFVVCDEAQAIKNPYSDRRKMVVQLQRTYSIAVTGTPVENTLTDLWSLSDFAIKGVLGGLEEFQMLYPDGNAAARDLAVVSEPYILNRKVADVANDLPERIDSDLPIDLGEKLAAEYERIRRETLREYGKAGALVAIGRLQLFCAHPWLIEYDHSNEEQDDASLNENLAYPLVTPKMEAALNLLETAFRERKKVLVFSIYNRIGELLLRAAADVRDLPTAYWGAINGSTPQARRQEIVDEFSSHEGPGVLILNPKAAGAGLNITAATIVIHYTQVWNPAIEKQASARAYRRGQDQPVQIHRLFYDNTVERIMLDRALGKTVLAYEAVKKSDIDNALRITPVAL
jgi:SNF2 family DNA or RNA helicase